MADSDDEYDRRRGRDKFRRERNDYERRDDRRREGGWDNDRYRNTSAARSRNNSGRNREVWSSRSRDRGNYNRDGYDSRRRDRYSPGSPPQMKRMRRDWDDNYQPYNDMPYGGGPMHGPGGPPHHWGPGPDMGGGMGPQQGQFGGPGPNRPDVDYPTQPPMLTFKQFLSQQDDNIDDQEAIKKYNEYKIDFRRQQINDFFLAHKEEEWFKAKYHPEECERKHEESRLGLQRRLSVFVELLGTPYVENVTVDMEKATELVKLLDAAVLKMEGGSEFDLKSLEEPEVAPEEGNRSRNDSESQSTDKIISPVKQRTRKDKEADTVTVVEGEATATPEGTAAEGPIELPMTKEQEDLKKAAQEFSKNQISPGAEDGDDGEGSTSGKKRKRGRDKSQYSYESGSDSDSGSESEPEPAPPGMEEDGETPRADTSAHNTTGSPEKPSPEAREAEPKRTPNKEVAEGEEKDIDTGSQEPQPRALHKTNSIFLRHLAPSITKQEVEAMCKRYPGFLRVALQDPLPERHFFRRGWVTFDRNVNIKDICYNLNNIRLRECELNATVNRELKQRVRPVSWMTSHKSVVRQDIKHTAKIIQNLDSKWGLWEDTADEKKDTEKEVPSYGLVSRNPVLKNITDYLVDEGSFEEEEYLGQSIDDEPKEANPELPLERDPTLLKVVDRMILYLRIVHSVDYYSATEFPNEDEMPNRCGIMHARGTTPNSKFSQADANEWTQNFERKLKNLLEVQGRVNEEEAVRLGRKDPAAEVEKFVTANTQELAKDKWLCPLSGKKFKGPEFVRKHIFNKHAEKIDEVKKEVSFFNNYLMDPKRPTLPEHPGNKPQGGREGFMGPGNFQGPPQQMGYNQSRPHMGYGNGPHYGSGPPRGDNFRQDGGFNRRNQHGRSFGRRSDPRGIIEYRDLDAPDDMDMF